MLMLSEANTQKRDQHNIIQEYKAQKKKVQENNNMIKQHRERISITLC